jgi:organic radical activating enzyme
MEEYNKLGEFKKELDAVGCGFCAAKWTQVTIHLQMGETHSCHHPTTHKISKSEIKKNPSALHNTRHKKRARKEMLDGKRPSECGYCWNIEDNSDEFSDRIYKSSDSWSKPYIEEIKELGWRGNFNPKYVEVAFTNACNFKCSYCGPSFSSKWVAEIKKHGAYPTTDFFNDITHLEAQGKMPLGHDEYNPYIEAFWKWWPDLYLALHTFRITGGEPLLAKDTWGILDSIIEHPNPNTNLELAINTNLGVSDDLIDKFIEKIRKIEDEGRVKNITIFTSIDTFGPQADYIRNGLDYNKWLENCNKIMSSTKKTCLTIMSTFNALSIFNYDKLIYEVYVLKQKYNHADRYSNPAIILDTSYLRYPLHQTVQILPMEFKDQILRIANLADGLRYTNNWMPTNVWEDSHIAFNDHEITKIKRIADWMESNTDEEQTIKNQKNFYRFMNAHDERRGTDFCKTFPELEEFYNQCKELK